jgi:hypothetical protein
LIKNSYTKPLYLLVWIKRYYLDRGKIGSTAIVKFNRVGNKILMIQPNYSFRKMITNDVAEKEQSEQSFAQSTIWDLALLLSLK